MRYAYLRGVEITQLNSAFRIHENVRRFDIAMDEPHIVKVLNCQAQLSHDNGHNLSRHMDRLPHEPLTINATEVFHHGNIRLRRTREH